MSTRPTRRPNAEERTSLRPRLEVSIPPLPTLCDIKVFFTSETVMRDVLGNEGRPTVPNELLPTTVT